MSWTISAWAVGRHPTTGAEQAARLQIKREDRDINEEFGLRGEASALYRRTYGAWAANVGSSAVSADGAAADPELPPGELKRDPDEDGGHAYTVPDEAVRHLPTGDDEATSSQS